MKYFGKADCKEVLTYDQSDHKHKENDQRFSTAF